MTSLITAIGIAAFIAALSTALALADFFRWTDIGFGDLFNSVHIYGVGLATRMGNALVRISGLLRGEWNMPRFKDAMGREWNPRVTCTTLQRFEEKCGVNIFDGAVLGTIDKSLSKMCALAYFACNEQAQKLNVSMDEFCNEIDNDVLLRGMIEATGEALLLFFQSRQNQEKTTAAQANPGRGSKSTK